MSWVRILLRDCQTIVNFKTYRGCTNIPCRGFESCSGTQTIVNFKIYRGCTNIQCRCGFESCLGTVKQLSILKYTAGAQTLNVVGSNPAHGLLNNCQFSNIPWVHQHSMSWVRILLRDCQTIVNFKIYHGCTNIQCRGFESCCQTIVNFKIYRGCINIQCRCGVRILLRDCQTIVNFKIYRGCTNIRCRGFESCLGTQTIVNFKIYRGCTNIQCRGFESCLGTQTIVNFKIYRGCTNIQCRCGVRILLRDCQTSVDFKIYRGCINIQCRCGVRILLRDCQTIVNFKIYRGCTNIQCRGFESCLGTVKQLLILKYTAGAPTFNVVVGFESCSA